MNKMALRFVGLGSFVERSATKAAIAQASLSAARRGARSDVAHIAPEVAAAYTLRMTRTRVVVFRCTDGRENLRYFLDQAVSDQYIF